MLVTDSFSLLVSYLFHAAAVACFISVLGKQNSLAGNLIANTGNKCIETEGVLVQALVGGIPGHVSRRMRNLETKLIPTSFQSG